MAICPIGLRISQPRRSLVGLTDFGTANSMRAKLDALGLPALERPSEWVLWRVIIGSPI
jgi:hypothetical protein